MKTIDVSEGKVDLDSVINLARKEPLLLMTADGKEFFVALADDFEAEVESLRRSQTFQRFLDERLASPRRIPLARIEAEIDEELAGRKNDT